MLAKAVSQKIKERNIVMAVGNDKITYIPHVGVVVAKGHDAALFKVGMDIRGGLVFPYEFEDKDPEDPEDSSSPLYMFFNETFRIWTEEDKTTISGMSFSHTFIFNGYELIGMDFEKFSQLNLFSFDYIKDSLYSVGSDINFRYYKVCYNLKYKFSVYIWRKKIREITINAAFFRKKLYKNIQFLDYFDINKQ